MAEVAGETRVLGKNIYVYGMKGQTPVLIACATKLSIDISYAKESSLCQGSEGVDTGEPGAESLNFTIEGMNRKFSTQEAATNFGYDDLYAIARSRGKLTIVFEDEETGIEKTGIGYIASLSTALDVMKNGTYSTTGWFNQLTESPVTTP